MRALFRSGILMVVIVTGLSGCDKDISAHIAEVERKIEAQNTQLGALEGKLAELQTKAFVHQITQDRYKSATFDPSDRGFRRLDTSVGMFAVSIEEVNAHADGVRVRLQVGNLTTATAIGGKFTTKWGVREPKLGTENWAKNFEDWEKSLNEKEIHFVEELRPGRWNDVVLILPGLPPDRFGYLSLEMTSTQIKLVVPQ